MQLLCLAVLLSLGAWFPLEARAHLGLDVPASRYGPDVLKTGPCGQAGGERGTNVTYYEPGETIEVAWNEYIEHPGHFRIAFDDNGDDDFVDPATMMELYSNDTVLLDDIPDQGPDQRNYVATVTLPDVSCDNCTLQVIQVMYDKPPYTTPGNDIYYQCADLVLRKGGAPDGSVRPDAGRGLDAGTVPDAGRAAGSSSGCNAAGSKVGELGAPAFLLLWLASQALARRRASRL